MKTKIILAVGYLLLNLIVEAGSKTDPTVQSSAINAINVYASPDLYGLAKNWATEYGQVDQNLKINLVKASQNEWLAIENSGEGIGFFGDDPNPADANQKSWFMVVGHDIIVPVINSQNPLIDEIYRKGISPARLISQSVDQGKPSWQKLFVNSLDGSDLPLHFYFREDEGVISVMNKFLDGKLTELAGTKVNSDQEIIEAIQKDPCALGFCKLTQVLSPDKRELAANIKLAPIDKNGNGKIDFIEDIYSNLETFSRGVWIGKYPKALSGTIYAVSAQKPQNLSELAFLKWVLTDGQLYLTDAGYRALVYNERQSQLNKISQPETLAEATANPRLAIVKIVFIVLIVFALSLFALDRVFRKFRYPNESVPVPKSQFLPAFDENSVIIPKGVFFDNTHTWAFMKKNGLVKVGIDDFIQHVTGPITRIEMKNSGDKIKKGEALFTIIQVGKQLTVYSPISGTITANNNLLKSQSSLLNSAPYTNGWVYLVEPLNWLLEVQFLIVADRYKNWLNLEFTRLKDFISRTIKVTSPEYDLVVMQDGGALKDCVLSGLGPETWEDFQIEFMDQSGKLKS